MLLIAGHLLGPLRAHASEYSTCENGVIHNVLTNPIPLRTTTDQFPPGDPYSDALAEVFHGWSTTASAMQYQCVIANPSANDNAFPNGVNEVYWTEDGLDGDGGGGWVGLCLTKVSGSECAVIETDVVFNQVLVNFTASTDVADVPVVAGGQGATYSFQAVAYHEFGHAQGLDHTADAYSIMGLVPHHHVNGSLAVAYPGEDAIMGSIGLYGSVPGGLNDLALAPFKRTGFDSNGYAIHDRNRVKHVANGPGSTGSEGDDHIVPGQTVKMEVTVENMGTSAHATTIGYYLSSDSNITTGDVFLGQHALDVYPDQPTTIDSPSLALPQNLVVGQDYWLGAVIDPTQSITEASEWNNRTYIKVRVDLWKPDLKALFVAGPDQAYAGGGNVFVSSNFSNVGGPIDGPVSYKIQLVDLNGTIPPELGGTTVLSVDYTNVGYHVDVFGIPHSIAPGEYHWALKVGSLAGGEGNALDAEESNFIVGNPVTILPGPTELVAAAVWGPPHGGDAVGMEAGDTVPIHFTVDNLGSAPTMPYIYHVVLSLNEDIAVTDWLVASGETTSTGTFHVNGTFPALPHGGVYHWGLIVTHTENGDDPSNNVLLGGDILVTMSSVIDGGLVANDEFVSGPATATWNQAIGVSFQIPDVLAGAFDYQIVLMTAAQVAGTTKTAPIVVAGPFLYNGGTVHAKVIVPSKSVPAGQYFWGVVLPNTSPKSKGPYKVVVGNEVSVINNLVGG